MAVICKSVMSWPDSMHSLYSVCFRLAYFDTRVLAQSTHQQTSSRVCYHWQMTQYWSFVSMEWCYFTHSCVRVINWHLTSIVVGCMYLWCIDCSANGPLWRRCCHEHRGCARQAQHMASDHCFWQGTAYCRSCAQCRIVVVVWLL